MTKLFPSVSRVTIRRGQSYSIAAQAKPQLTVSVWPLPVHSGRTGYSVRWGCNLINFSGIWQLLKLLKWRKTCKCYIGEARKFSMPVLLQVCSAIAVSAASLKRAPKEGTQEKESTYCRYGWTICKGHLKWLNKTVKPLSAVVAAA